MSNGNENAPASGKQAATDDSFETTATTITEAEAIRLTASMIIIGGGVR